MRPAFRAPSRPGWRRAPGFRRRSTGDRRGPRAPAPGGCPAPAPDGCDFTEHRWVGERREEAYSDWLTWVLAQADAAEVLLILGAADTELSAACGHSLVSIARESFAAEGHEGSTGRPDLRVSLG